MVPMVYSSHPINSFSKIHEKPDIHAVMIQDKVRTSTYAHFILTNPSLFRDAVVLDVGCGTGILSLFAARAGAKRVISVDASNIAEKAEKIAKANNFDDVITVVRGKIENIQLPADVDKVDIIISEWMGYALLYESMLDSVLVARDRFLRPGGVMAPSQCQMMLALCDGSEIYKDRIGFWDDVYGKTEFFFGPLHTSDEQQGLICLPCRPNYMTKRLLMLLDRKLCSASHS
jgi:protein arginine N-methyltransferase 3